MEYGDQIVIPWTGGRTIFGFTIGLEGMVLYIPGIGFQNGATVDKVQGVKIMRYTTLIKGFDEILFGLSKTYSDYRLLFSCQEYKPIKADVKYGYLIVILMSIRMHLFILLRKGEELMLIHRQGIGWLLSYINISTIRPR